MAGFRFVNQNLQAAEDLSERAFNLILLYKDISEGETVWWFETFNVFPMTKIFYIAVRRVRTC